VVTSSVGDPWILIPVMFVDLAVTFVVVASIAQLLLDGDNDERPVARRTTGRAGAAARSRRRCAACRSGPRPRCS
jgi:hypothetical protein